MKLKLFMVLALITSSAFSEKKSDAEGTTESALNVTERGEISECFLNKLQ